MNKNTDNYRIDSKVIAVMLALSAFFLLLMAFRYKNTKPCPPVDFSFRTANPFDVAYEKEKIYFSSAVKNAAESWAWDFGDKSPADETSGPYASHVYAAPGLYTVRLTVNGKCQQVRDINIGKREAPKKLYLRPMWPGSTTLVAGQEYDFGDTTSGAKIWNWYFEGDNIRRDKQAVKYQFTEPGEYKVILVINNDVENGKDERIFKVVAPPRINTPIAANPGGGRNPGGGGNPNRDINVNPPGDIPASPGGTPGKSIEDMVAEQSKMPSLGEALLAAYVRDVNGGGMGQLKKYFKNNNAENCTILFNGRSITWDMLKENMVEHDKNGKSLSASQDVDKKENFIKVIMITAELKPKERLLGKDKRRNYPHE